VNAYGVISLVCGWLQPLSAVPVLNPVVTPGLRAGTCCVACCPAWQLVTYLIVSKCVCHLRNKELIYFYFFKPAVSASVLVLGPILQSWSWYWSQDLSLVCCLDKHSNAASVDSLSLQTVFLQVYGPCIIRCRLEYQSPFLFHEDLSLWASLPSKLLGFGSTILMKFYSPHILRLTGSCRLFTT